MDYFYCIKFLLIFKSFLGAQKTHLNFIRWVFVVELLGRFELPTSSLPRMRSTY